MNPTKLTYKMLIDAQKMLVTLNQLPKQTFANRLTALRRFLGANQLNEDEPIGLEMRPHFPLCVDKMVDKLRDEGKPDRDISNTKSALMSWCHAVARYDTESAYMADQPTPFMALLKATIKDHPVALVARQAGVPIDMLSGWLRGKSPRARSEKYIRRLEAFFGIERNSLVGLAGFALDLRKKAEVPPAIGVEFRVRQRERVKDGYILKVESNSPLRSQWRELMVYKTQPAPILERTTRGRWTCSPLVFKTYNDSCWHTFLDGVEVPSAHAVAAKVFSYLGFLGVSIEDGGIGLPLESLQTLAWLAVPDYIERYLNWMKARAGNKFTSGTIQFIATVNCLMRPGYGFLAQQPEYQMTLPAKYHQIDWGVLCEKQFKYLTKLTAAYTPDICTSRDSFAPLAHIIGLPQPMEAVADMIQRMRHDRPTSALSAEAIWARDILLVKLFASNPLRLRNMSWIEWMPQNVEGKHPSDKCAIYQRVDKSWWIYIPKRFLKNRGGAAIYDYDSPVNEGVWKDLERYLTKYRPVLMQFPTDVLLLPRGRDVERATSVKSSQAYKKPAPTQHGPWKDISKRLAALTKRYLWRCDGIGSHAFRHITATSILKAPGGDIKTAAQVLHDSEPTISKHYSGLRSGDGNERMAELLKASFGRM
jgi:hypothetical protein